MMHQHLFQQKQKIFLFIENKTITSTIWLLINIVMIQPAFFQWFDW